MARKQTDATRTDDRQPSADAARHCGGRRTQRVRALFLGVAALAGLLLLAGQPAGAQSGATMPGLLGEYFHNPDFTDPAFARIDATPKGSWGPDAPSPWMDGDTFSVRWSGYFWVWFTGEHRFRLSVDDTARLYINNVLVQSGSGTSGPVMLTKDQHVPIRVEYVEGTGDASVVLDERRPNGSWGKLSPPRFSTSTGLLATYHDDATLTDPVVRRVDPNVNQDWGNGGPLAGVGGDDFSVRWTGFVTAPTTGDYTFYTRSDDGARVSIANTIVLDDWNIHPAVEDVPSSPVHLVAGVPTQIQVDYFERGGGASIQLQWSGPGLSRQVVPRSFLVPALDVAVVAPDVPGITAKTTHSAEPVSYAAPFNDPTLTCTPASGSPFPRGTNQVACRGTDGSDFATFFAVTVDPAPVLLGEYFHDPELREPAFERLDPGPTFHWRTATPDPRLHPDTFSVRWTGQITIPRTGAYTFYTQADDATRLYLDDQVVIDTRDSPDCCMRETSEPLSFVAGQKVNVRIEYIEFGGHANMVLTWSGPGFSERTLPTSVLSTDAGLLATYYSDEAMTLPVSRRVEANIDHDWTGMNPAPVPGSDAFSVRWSGFVTAPTTGAYTFYARGDDAARVAIAGALVLDHGQPAADQDIPSTPVHLVAGVPTPIQVDYFGTTAHGSMELKWSGPDVPLQTVPKHAVTPALEWTKGIRPLQIDAKGLHSCAVLASGDVHCWGRNDFGEADDRLTGDVVRVATGFLHTCALLQSGNVDCWGAPGMGDYNGGDAVAVTAGEHYACALQANGNVACWGPGSPQAAGYHGGDAKGVVAGIWSTCAVLESGNIDCWGSGDAAEDYFGGNAVQAAVGAWHACALLNTGNVDCWGRNDLGQAEDYGGGDAVAVMAGPEYTCAVLDNGNAECWGQTMFGPPTDRHEGDVVAVAGGNGHVCMLLLADRVQCWGANFYGQLNARFDITPPTIAVPNPVILETNGPDGALINHTMPTSDEPLTCTTLAGLVLAVGTYPSTCTAADRWGHTATRHFAVQVVPDTTAPNTTIELVGPAGENGWYLGPVNVTLVCTDNGWGCDTTRYLLDNATWHESQRLTIIRQGTTVIDAFYSEDVLGNVESPQGALIHIDSVPPTISAHADEVHEATGPAGAAVTYVPPGWTDNVIANGLATCIPASGAFFAFGETTVTCAARDTAGNAAENVTFTLSVVDTSPPVIEAHPDEVHEATGPNGTTVPYSAPRWNDLVSGTGTTTCTPTSNATFALGITTVTCLAPPDAAGNEAAPATFEVAVVDTTPPTLEPRTDQVHEATGPDGATVHFSAPAWTDLVDGNGTSTCAPTHGTTFALGNTTITCTATDAANNTGTTAFNVSVVDTTPPAIDAHAHEVHEATGPQGTNVTYDAPSWSDIVSGNGTSLCAPMSNMTFPLGNTTVTCVATDGAGNAATTNFTVMVQDTTPPVIQTKPDQKQTATAFGGANISYAPPVWTDIVDGNGTATCTPASGTFQPMGNTTITCNASDAAGNQANASSFQVTVVPGPVHRVDVTPQNRTVNLAQPVTFGAQGYDQYGNANATVPTWSAENGTIDANGTYLGGAVGLWQLNASMDDVVGVVLVNVTDRLRVDVQMDAPSLDAVGALADGVRGTVNVTLWDNTPQANATVAIVVSHYAAGVGLRETSWSVTTGTDGTARFQVPDDYALVGDYEVAVAADWSGNSGEATTGYAIGP